jgi:hypothetical protein
MKLSGFGRQSAFIVPFKGSQWVSLDETVISSFLKTQHSYCGKIIDGLLPLNAVF